MPFPLTYPPFNIDDDAELDVLALGASSERYPFDIASSCEDADAALYPFISAVPADSPCPNPGNDILFTFAVAFTPASAPQGFASSDGLGVCLAAKGGDCVCAATPLASAGGPATVFDSTRE